MNYFYVTMRGGSKRIPNKNIIDLNGYPLCYYVLKAAQDAKLVDKIIVVLDGDELEDVVNSFGFDKVETFRVPLIDDFSLSDDTLISALVEKRHNDEDTIIYGQVTSPLTTSEDIDGAIELYEEKKYDSLLSVVKFNRFVWTDSKEGGVKPMNYDPKCRVRTQDMASYYMENGAFYITKNKSFIDEHCRISGLIGVYVMRDETSIEIDNLLDIQLLGSV